MHAFIISGPMPGQGTASDLTVMHALFISGQTHTRLGYTVTSHSYACIYHFRLDARVGAQQVSPDQVPLGTVHICK